MKPSVAIVGCGRVGTALGQFLHAGGYPMAGLFSRSRTSAERTATAVGAGDVHATPWAATQAADVVFITTPDDAIESVCRRIAGHGGFRSGAVVFHCSGSLSSTLLSSARGCGAGVGSLHPLQSFATATYEQNPFRGVVVTVEGDPAAVGLAQQITADLGAALIRIETGGKKLYHAAAVVASNYLVTLMHFALELIGQAGISGRDALAVLQPLVAGTLANIERAGTVASLTGPIARGDRNTVEEHLKAIRAALPASDDLYRTLGRHTVDIAEAGKRLDAAQAGSIRKLFETDP